MRLHLTHCIWVLQHSLEKLLEDDVPSLVSMPHLHATLPVKDSLEDYGQGYCKHGYLRGWDRKGIESQAACNAVCLAEADCTYAAWNSGKTCSRYKGASCRLNGVGDHYTYKKVHGLAGSVTSPPPTLRLPVRKHTYKKINTCFSDSLHLSFQIVIRFSFNSLQACQRNQGATPVSQMGVLAKRTQL